MRLNRVWELLAVLIIGAIIIREAIDIIKPLVPYMLMVVALIGIASIFYQRNRSW